LFRAVLLGLAFAWVASADAAETAGRLVFLEGEVAMRPSGSVQWQKAKLHQDLFGGDTVRTGANSRAAILCLDESQIRLNQHTVLTLKSVAPSPRLRFGEIAPAAQAQEEGSRYEVIQGEIWLRNKKEQFLFELHTPIVTATIRGTELNVRVEPDGTTSIVMLEGEIRMANRYGEVVVAAGEEGLARPGKAPTKQVLVQPADAVQWSLFYPGYFSYRDLPLAAMEGPGRSALPSQGVGAYDQGRIREAGVIADQILARNPADSGALTLAGWVHLQRRQPDEALKLWQRVAKPGVAAVIGTALARYQSGDAVGAYDLMQAARQANPGDPVVTAMAGYFAMLIGKVPEARQLFSNAAAGSSPVARLLAWCYLAQMDIVQNRKAEARNQADQALALMPASPLALLTRALANIADFQVPAAQQRLEKALDTDPGFMDAALYLTRVYLGGDYFIKARRTMAHALSLAPHEARVLAMAGFVDIAFRRYANARDLFRKAIEESPQLAEAHLGLALCQFRFGEKDQALKEMLTATLLDPRMAAYQSELGKAFYQVHAFDKSLATWDYAAKLDPKDPMPHFYKGIALTDLNRPGEAIESINRSIALNDNRAVFRSRLLLNKDQSTNNYNLARAYNQLELSEWARSKALTAVKLDPFAGVPHLFLAQSDEAVGQLPATDAESLLYRVLSPANQNTFRFLLENDYTTMFEMPYARATIQGGVGSWQERKTINDDFVAAYGGLPGAAFYGRGSFTDDRGFRDTNGFSQLWNAEGLGKLEPTVQGNLTGFVQYANAANGDITALNNYFFRNDKNLRNNIRGRFLELSYLHHFTPNCSFLGYIGHHNTDDHAYTHANQLIDPDFNITLRNDIRNNFDFNFDNLQLQQQVIFGQHNLTAGFDYFYGVGTFDFKITQALAFQDPMFDGLVIPFEPFHTEVHPPEKTYSFYLMDYWRPAPWLLAELGVFRDVTRNIRTPNPVSVSGGSVSLQPIGNSLWSPRVGLNFLINPQHTLRLAVLQYVNTHLIVQPLLVPAEVAGLAWPLDSKDGAIVRQAGGSWEAQWDPKTFTVLRFEAARISTPEYFYNFIAPTPMAYPAWATWRRYRASLILNRILTNALGLTLGVEGKRVFPDDSFRNPETFAIVGVTEPLNPYTEVSGLCGLSFLTPRGWQGGVRTRLLYQFLKGRDVDNLVPLVSLRFGKELANKRGLVLLEVDNLVNRHYHYLIEPRRIFVPNEFFPARRIIGKVQLWF
jgi:tetratricopeptide (TPR) repeat protein